MARSGAHDPLDHLAGTRVQDGSATKKTKGGGKAESRALVHGKVDLSRPKWNSAHESARACIKDDDAVGGQGPVRRGRPRAKGADGDEGVPGCRVDDRRPEGERGDAREEGLPHEAQTRCIYHVDGRAQEVALGDLSGLGCQSSRRGKGTINCTCELTYQFRPCCAKCRRSLSRSA